MADLVLNHKIIIQKHFQKVSIKIFRIKHETAFKVSSECFSFCYETVQQYLLSSLYLSFLFKRKSILKVLCSKRKVSGNVMEIHIFIVYGRWYISQRLRKFPS
jgi:hypothetical protein